MKLATVFSDHAILQREKPIAIWGWAKPLDPVAVKLGNSVAHSACGIDGKFLIKLPAMPAGGPYKLEVKSGKDKITLKDIWIGEVWLASGQSNMQFRVHELKDFAEGDALGANRNIRMINIPNTAYAGGRQSDIVDAKGRPAAQWEPASTISARLFSAVAAYFAESLAKETGLKIGIINSSWGGTMIEAWISRETLVQNSTQLPVVTRYEEAVFLPKKNTKDGALKPGMPGYLPTDPGNKGEKKGWANLSFDDSSWKTMKLPCFWTSQGFKHSGVFWFRKVIEVPKAWAGKDLKIGVGAVDKTDITYFNGKKIGATGEGFDITHWNVERHYTIPGKLVKAGRNVIAVRAYSFIFDGGMHGPEWAMYIKPARGKGEPQTLKGEWKFNIEHNFGLTIPADNIPGPGNPNTPHILFDNMIAPLLPYSLRGAIWYQGCSNTSRAHEYEQLLKDLVRDWRFQFGQGQLPFYVVQIANFKANNPDIEAWAKLRETQLKVLSEPGTGLAVTIDIGESGDIHPKNKKDVGYRLARWALRDVHGKEIEVSGPLYESASVEGSAIRIKFSHVAGGLVARGGDLGAFTIADASKNFVPAKAVIDGNTVVVSSPDISTPLHVRYAWAEDPINPNLYNSEGLPASPFRTDN